MRNAEAPEDEVAQNENRRRQIRRNNEFLADRLQFWLPDQTMESLTASIAALPDDEFHELFKTTFKLNTVWNISNASLELAKRGWFIDLEVPPPIAVEWAFSSNDHKGKGDFGSLEDYYQSRRFDIEKELVTTFPHRERFVRAGFKAHDAKEYESSVVLFLVQADGICQDAFGAELYRIKRGAAAVHSKLKNKTVDFVWDAAATPLYAALPIALHEKPGSGKFNRHLILHGRSLDYATLENSLRAISLLSFLQGLVSYEREKGQGRKG